MRRRLTSSIKWWWYAILTLQFLISTMPFQTFRTIRKIRSDLLSSLSSIKYKNIASKLNECCWSKSWYRFFLWLVYTLTLQSPVNICLLFLSVNIAMGFNCLFFPVELSVYHFTQTVYWCVMKGVIKNVSTGRSRFVKSMLIFT